MERTKILAKLNAIQKEVERMAKEGRNQAQGYKYLGETQIAEAFKPLLEKHGVFFVYSSKITGTQTTVSGKQTLTEVQVDYEFVDMESGEYVAGTAAGQGSDPNDKGVYKAVTGAIKYIFMKSFVIPTGDDPEDDSGESRVSSAKPAGTKGVINQTKPPFGPGSDED